jgi:lipopolysaccharide transport system permease protein
MLKQLSLLRYLAWSDIKKRNSDTSGGIFWAFFAPASLIGAMWFALDFGLGLRNSIGPEYGVAMITGMVAWLLFADSANDATNSVLRSPHLVKQVVFPVGLLPLSSVGSAFFIHLVLIALLAFILALSGSLVLTMVWTLPLWMVISLVLSSGMALLFSSITVVLRDAKAAIPFITTVWFWLSPVVWPIKNVPADYRWMVALNPMAILIEGYRMALTGSVFPFDSLEVATGLSLTVFFLFAGWLMFNTLRPSFADAL